MFFNSLAFAVFLPVVFAAYWALAKKPIRFQHATLLLASYYFYGSWDWRFLGLIVISSATDYFIGQCIYDSEDPVVRRRWLQVSLLINLGILGIFKYFDFFATSFAAFLELWGITATPMTLNVVLPVGISFYTFQTLSYTIDIYRNRLEPTRDALAFFTFVAFFPQLVAGPIERAASLLPQFATRRAFSRAQAVSGLQMILWGMVKKVVIADNLALYVDPVFDDPSGFSGLALVLATLAFGLQIYCDFSGYSDIAIGTARLFGIELMTNFRTPYFSTSIREFWSRWHISLSTWFRDYVYIALGGNRTSRSRWRIHILITFLLSGLWHGANITFVVWGLVHGLAYMAEQALAIPKRMWFSGLATYLAVHVAWVFFRANNLADAVAIFRGMGAFWRAGWTDLSWFLVESDAELAGPNGFGLVFSLVLFVALEAMIGRGEWPALLARLSRPGRWAVYYGLILWIAVFGAFEAPKAFIYFQF